MGAGRWALPLALSLTSRGKTPHRSSITRVPRSLSPVGADKDAAPHFSSSNSESASNRALFNSLQISSFHFSNSELLVRTTNRNSGARSARDAAPACADEGSVHPRKHSSLPFVNHPSPLTNRVVTPRLAAVAFFCALASNELVRGGDLHSSHSTFGEVACAGAGIGGAKCEKR